jgi:DNA mismatch repair protein MSH5
VKLHVEPTVILISTRIDDNVVDRLDPELRMRNSSVLESSMFSKSMSVGDINASFVDDQFRLPYILEIRPSAEFNYEFGRSKLVNLRLDSDDGPTITFTIPNDVIGAESPDLPGDFTGRQEHLLRLGGWIDVESRITVCISRDFLEFSIQRLTALGGLCWSFDLISTETEGSRIPSW